MDWELLSREWLRALRGTRTQPAFSRRLGYRSNVVWTWEAGHRWPTAAEAMRAAVRAGVDVRGAWARFYRTPPEWLATVDPTTRAGVAALLRDLRGTQAIGEAAARAGVSRYQLLRWLGEVAEPKLPQLWAVVEALSLRALDLVAATVDIDTLPSAREAWARLEAQRRTAYDAPWTQAVLRGLELVDYPPHRPGWLAARLGISRDDEEHALALLAASGQVRWLDEAWRPVAIDAVDTRRDAAAGRRLKAFWAKQGVQRLEADAPGLFSYNVFSISEADFERLQQMHLAYFRALRAAVAASEVSERVVVANVQLFALDAPRAEGASSAPAETSAVRNPSRSSGVT